MRSSISYAAAAAVLVASASAQVTQYAGPSPNLPTVNLDFDNPFVPDGPITGTDPAFTNAGISQVTLITTTGWTNTGDTASPGVSGVMGQGLITQLGGLAVGGATAGTSIENPGAGDGWEISFASPVDEFQCILTDQTGMTFDVELLSGGASLGTGTFTYPGFGSLLYWRGPSAFDTIRITFPTGTGGVGIDEWSFGNGPAPPPPANDDCANASPVNLGSNVIGNLLATTSASGSACGADVSDVWYSYTAPAAGDIRFDTCGSGFDTVLEVYTGTCGALVSQGCSDDACGTGSAVDVFGVSAGDTFLIQIGGSSGAQGSGNLEIGTPPPPPPPSCATTIFAANNGGAAGGAVFFDMTLTQASSFSGLLTNSGVASGLPIGVSVYTCATTYLGNEQNGAAWTLVAEDDGSMISLGADFGSPATFVAPFSLPAGTHGICVVADNFTTGSQFNHQYTNGTGTNQNFSSADGVVTLDLGAGQNTPFSSGVFSPRVWNGQLCHGGPVAPGTNYCTANVNSTGVTGSMAASGSNIVANNDLVLEANDLPLSSFGFFLTSTVQGFVANPGGSQGNLCLGGAIGRYVGPGQIQNSGTTGSISLAIDNTQVPQPTGFVTIAAGETWSFQAWHRDAVGGSATSNFTDGYEITFN